MSFWLTPENAFGMFWLLVQFEVLMMGIAICVRWFVALIQGGADV